MLSLCVGCLYKASRGRQGHPVGPGAINIAEVAYTAWLIMSWKVYRGYTGDGIVGKATARV